MTIWGLSIRSLVVDYQPRSEIGLEVCLGLDDDSHLSTCQREGRGQQFFFDLPALIAVLALLPAKKQLF